MTHLGTSRYTNELQKRSIRPRHVADVAQACFGIFKYRNGSVRSVIRMVLRTYDQLKILSLLLNFFLPGLI